MTFEVGSKGVDCMYVLCQKLSIEAWYVFSLFDNNFVL